MEDLAAAAAEARLVFAIPEGERALLARVGETLVWPANHELIRQGDDGHEFFLVLAGELEINEDGRRIGLVTTGGVLGEMALFNEHRRTGTVRTLTECKLVRVDAHEFVALVHKGEPAALAMMERLGGVMVERLQQAERAQSMRQVSGGAASDDEASALRKRMLREWSLRYHSLGEPGKLEVRPTRSLTSAADIAIAHAPGAIEPCVAIHNDPSATWEYTARGRLIGVVSNGSSVLGRGALGPDATKPLLEGKVILLKRFAGLDAFDLELAELDPTRFVDLVCALEPTFGALTLEHLASPSCLAVVDACSRRMQIPVLHDEQHCTAVVVVAALLNALHVAGKSLLSARVVLSGEGAAAAGVGQLLRTFGVPRDQLVVIDREGPLHGARQLRSWFQDLAAEPCPRDRASAIDGADAYVGCGDLQPLSPPELRSMAANPVVIALGTPVPEMTWPQAMRTRNDVVMATSDATHGNHVTTLLAFPHLLRALVDCRATGLPTPALCAAADTLASLARAGGPDLQGVTQHFGRGYLLPAVTDPRLPQLVPVAVVDAVTTAGLAGLRVDIESYHQRRQRFTPTLGST